MKAAHYYRIQLKIENLTLELSNNYIGDEGIKCIANTLINLNNLQNLSLNLSYTNIFSDGEDNYLINNTKSNFVNN